jgi:hypothetical protein
MSCIPRNYDLVGSVNMHELAYGAKVMFPRSVTYLRPGKSRRSSRAGTPLASPSGKACDLDQSPVQPLLVEQVSLGRGYPGDGVQKPISL